MSTKHNIYGSLHVNDNITGDTLNILTVNNNNSLTQILGKNSVSGNVEYIDVSSIVGSVSADTYVVSGNADSATSQLSFTYNTGGTFTVANSAALFSDNDINVTGGTYNPSTGCVTFATNSGTTFDVCGFVTGITDSYTTGSTLVGESIQFDNNILGSNYYNVNLTPALSGKTNLSLFNSHTANTVNPHQTSFGNLVSTAHTHSISEVINLQSELDDKLDVSAFNSYSGDVSNQLSAKIENGINLGSANEIFSGKSGTDFYFRTISGGTNATITTVGDIVNIDVETDITKVQGGTNITTGGTVNSPIVSLDSDISLNSVSATNLSGGTLYSGSTDLSDIFLTTNDGNDITRVSGGTNITTGGTANNPIINVDDSPVFNSLITSGQTTINSNFTVTGNTLISGTTTIGNDLEPNVDNIVDLGAPSLRWREIYTTNLDATNAVTANSLYAGFEIESPSISGTSVSATTFYSGSTDLSDIFLTTADGNDITRVQPGNNINTGGTANNPIVNLDDDISLISVSATTISGGTFYGDGSNLSGINDFYLTGQTFNNSNYILTSSLNDGSVLNSDLSVLASDIFVISGVYSPSTGVVTYTNSSGGTFNVSGFTTGMTDSYTNAANLNGNLIEFDNNIQGSNFYNVDLSQALSAFTTGDTFVTGFTYNDNNTFTIFDNDGGSFPATISQVSGLTVNGTLSATTLDGNTILSGGTNLLTIIDDRDDFVTGVTWNNNGLLTTSLNNGTNIPTTIDTFSGITINNFIDFTQVTPSAPTPVAGRTFYSEGDNALSYHPDTPLMDVTINMGQEGVIRIYNNTGVQINNGQACHISGSFSGTPIVELSIASGITVISDTSFEVSGVATHDIPDSTYGFITTYGLVRDLNITGVAEGSPIWVSDTVPGGFIYSLPTTNASRITQIGYVITTGATDAKIMVQIENEQTVGILSAKEFEVISLNLSSTGLREGGLISADSSTTFKISAGSGIVMDTTTIPSSPVLTEVAWPDITGNTLTSLTGDVATVIMMNSNNTIQQYPLVSPPSQSDKRDRILLGVVAHSDKVSITNIYNGPIEILSPVNQIEDLTSSIGTFSINGNFISGISGTLELQKAIGDSFYYGGNYQTDKKNPSVLNTAVLSGSSTPSNPLVYATGTDVLGLSGYSINSDNYDPSGLGVITPLAPNKFTAHRIWHLPINNLLVFQYGQTEYNSLGVAIEGFSTENFVEPPGLNLGAYLISVIVTQEGETDLTNTTTTKFIQQGKFAGVGGGGGTIADTLQSAYSNSTSPEIVTDSTRGAVDYRIGTGTDSDNLVTFQQTGGVINAFITGEGNSSFNNISGDTLQLNTIPTLNATGTDILVRNSTTGVVDYRPVSGITPDLNTFVSGGTYNDTTNNINFSGNSLETTFDVDLTDLVSSVSGNTFVVGGTYIDSTSTIALLRNDGNFVNVTGVTNTYVTGGTVSIPATNNSNDGTIGLFYKDSDGIPRTLPFEDTYTSGTTFASNQATLTRNDGTEVFKLTGGTNVVLSNPSANQIKLGLDLGIKSGTVRGVDFTGTPLTLKVTFTTPYPDSDYSVSITGSVNRNFTFQSKTAASFIINANSSTSFSDDVDWSTIKYGEQ